MNETVPLGVEILVWVGAVQQGQGMVLTGNLERAIQMFLGVIIFFLFE